MNRLLRELGAAAILLFALTMVGGLPAQRQISYYNWTTSYGPVVSSASPTGYYNSFTAQDTYSSALSSQAYCVSSPFPGAFIQFGFQMLANCGEGAYISEDGSNGTFPPDGVSLYNVMYQNGTSIDGLDTTQTLEIFQWEYSCGMYYTGPVVDYDDYLNYCQY